MPGVCGEVSAVDGWFAPGHLGELTQIVPFEMVDAALEETGSFQQRLGDLPSRVVVYLLLAGCLFPEVGYSGVWRKLTAGLGAGPAPAIPTPSASALAQARRRIGPAPLRWLFDLLRGPVAQPGQPGTWWRRAAGVRDRRDHLDGARPISKYQARGTHPDRASYKATLSIDILTGAPP